MARSGLSRCASGVIASPFAQFGITATRCAGTPSARISAAIRRPMATSAVVDEERPPLPAGLAGIKTFSWIMRLPRSVVMTAVVVFSVVGAYSLRNSLFDVYVMVVFGLVGFALESRRVPLAPLILGLILGPMIEENLRVGFGFVDGLLAGSQDSLFLVRKSHI